MAFKKPQIFYEMSSPKIVEIFYETTVSVLPLQSAGSTLDNNTGCFLSSTTLLADLRPKTLDRA